MLRSLYAGISGLRSHQTMLDVTGNNIANVNTTGFKVSATQFQDTLSQMVQGAGGAQPDAGGTNPAQVGLGVRVAGISTNFSQGAAQSTGKASDMMISGDGFFVTRLGNETLFTRAGAFDFDSEGRLVSPDGSLVQGWTAVKGVIQTGGAVGDITLPRQAIAPANATQNTVLGGNLPAEAADNTTITRDVSVYDQQGASRTLTLTFEKSGTDWSVLGSDGTASQSVTLTPTPSPGDPNTFTASGAFTVGGITVDLTALTGYAGVTTVAINSQDGRTAGTLESYTLSKDGTLIGSFSNGAKESIARIALGNFVNPGGLEKAGSSGYRATINSGTAEYGTPGSAGLGSLAGGALEMSNVDLSQEFTNLIVAQRGFQANARVITTSDEVLQELTNLKR
jgi:flagellar hook protein FlgE